MNHAERIAPLDAMRGLAALGVLAFHFLWTNPSVPAGALKSLGYYGWLGVPVFFVISGLVIPHSLHRGGYRVSDYFIFVCKRLARLEPPYLASILVVVLVWCVYRLWPYVPHPSPFADPKGLVLHLGYLNAFFGRRWLNPVYWTLAIEFQYYVGVGLLYPLLAHTRRAARLAVMSLLASAVFLVPGDQFIFLHLPHFFVGTALFQHRAGLTSGRECVLTIGALLVLAAFTMSLPGALAGLAAALCIRFARLRQRPLVFAGDISYSLYLLHLPVGGVVLHASRLHGVGWPFAVIAATAASVFAAWLMYLFVERPSRRLSSRIRYRRQADASAFPARAAEAPAA